MLVLYYHVGGLHPICFLDKTGVAFYFYLPHTLDCAGRPHPLWLEWGAHKGAGWCVRGGVAVGLQWRCGSMFPGG